MTCNDAAQDSILLSVKKMITGADPDYDIFDTDLIVHINSSIMTLRQLGVGPQNGFCITGASETWGDYLGSATNYESVKTVMTLMVKTIFDPPSSSYVLDSYKKIIDELQWRLLIEAEMDNRHE